MREFQRQSKPQRIVDSPEIAHFLQQHAVPSHAAPLYVAGFAQRSNDGWTLFGGASAGASLATPFDLASVTKPVFAVLVAQLVAQRALSWETRLQEVLPEVVETWAGGQTIESLLSHRAGLVPHVELFRPSWSGTPIKKTQLLRWAARSRSSDPPEHPRYCDLGYLLTGVAVERLLEQPLDKIISREVCVPWGLEIGSARAFHRAKRSFSSQVAATENQAPRGGMLRGAVHDDNAWALSGCGVSGHAGLFGTLEAVLRFGAQLLELDGDRTPANDSSWFAPLVKRRPGGTLRMGFDGISGSQSLAGRHASSETFGHLGFTGTSIWCDPTQERVTVLLTNRVSPTRDNQRVRALRPKIHDFLWLC